MDGWVGLNLWGQEGAGKNVWRIETRIGFVWILRAPTGLRCRPSDRGTRFSLGLSVSLVDFSTLFSTRTERAESAAVLRF